MVELLVTIALAGLVGSAVAAVYQVSQQTYTRASSLEAAQVGARAGLDRMANELRLIGSYWVGATCIGIADCNAITAATANSITFRANVHDLYMPNAAALEATATNNVTGNTVSLSISAANTTDAFRVYQNTALNDFAYIANGARREVKQITGIGGSQLTLATNLSSAYPVGSLVRDVKRITYTRNTANNTLTRTQGGDTTPDPIVDNVTGLTFTYFLADGVTQTAIAALIREIQIALTVQSPDGSTRPMTTRVKLRNLS